jgi:hypothetical protein
MKRTLFAGLACLGLLVGATYSYALRIAGPIFIPIPQRVMQADTIVVGKVTGVEEKTVKAVRFQGDAEKGEYRVFTVKIEQNLMGGKGLTHIKVGCLMPAAPPPPPVVDPAQPRPFVRPIRPFPIQQPPMLEKGQEVLLFLKPHLTETFYTLGQQSDVINKSADTFKNDLAQAVKAVKLLNDPMDGLKAKDAQDRFLTAAMLVLKYRTATGPSKEEEISAEESKLILQGLAAGNFETPRVGRPGFDPMAPMTIFYQLNPQASGWMPPMDFTQTGPSMKKWLEDNAGKYRIKRFVLQEKK